MSRTKVFAAFVIAVSAFVVLPRAWAGSRPEQETAPGTGSMMMSAAEADSKSPRFAPSTGRKVIFTSLADAQALAAQGPVVLFFAADWCPTCIGALRDINANGSRLGDITVVVVDYDSASDLKSRYGVTSQHTFVQIDAGAGRLAAWNGGGVDAILRNTRKG